MKRISAHFKSWIAKKYRLLLTLCILMVAQWGIWPLKLHLAKHSIVPINLPKQLPQHRLAQQRRIKSEGPAGPLGGSQSGGNQGGIDLPLPMFTQSRCWACFIPPWISRALPGLCVRETSLCTAKNHLRNTAALVPIPAWYKCTILVRMDIHPFPFWSIYGTSPMCYSAVMPVYAIYASCFCFVCPKTRF